jgi:hypothetical protein
MVIWYIFSRFGMLYQEKSGNPVFKLAPMLSTLHGVYARHVMKKIVLLLIFPAYLSSR